MKNGIFLTDWAMVIDALLTAVIFSVLTAAVGVVTMSGFDVFTADWVTIGHSMTNVAVISGVVSLGKDFLSTNDGSLLGVGPSNTPQE